MPKRRPDSPPDDGASMVLGRRADARMAGWTTFERDLPSAAVAVFNRCTLHRLDTGKLVLIGTAAHTPSSVMSESVGTATVLWADLQENPQSPTLLAVGTSDDRVRIYNAATGEMVWQGSALGTAYGILVRDVLVLASDSAVHVICWALTGSEPKTLGMTLPVICRHGTMLLVATVVGPNVRCTLMDVMHPDMPSKVMAEVPHSLGHPLVMASDVMKDGRFFVRIVCAEGIHVLHQSGHTPIQGSYSECGVFCDADGSIMLLASLCTPGLDIFSVDGRLKTTLWPAKGGPSPISVRSVSSNTGLFCTIRREAYSPAYPVLDDYNMARTKTKPIKVKKEKHADKPEKSVDPEKPAGKKRRADPQGRKMLRRIKRAQQSTDHCIPRAAIKRLIREEVQNINGEIRLTSEAIDALREASETYLVDAFRDGQYLQSDIAVGSTTLRVPAFLAATQLKIGNTVSLPKPKRVAPKPKPVAVEDEQ